MDAIEHISSIFEADVRDRLEYLQQVHSIIDSSSSLAEAARRIRKNRLIRKDIKLCEVIFRLPCEIQRLLTCLEELPHIRIMARKVLVAVYLSDEQFYVFNQEVCFSYACKMLAGMGPRRAHFTNHSSLSGSDLQKAEIHLAMHSPPLFTGPDMTCHEQMDSPRRDRLPTLSSSCSSTPSTIASLSSEIGQNLEPHDVVAIETLLSEGDHAEDAIVLV
jgi:hypothetical protein